MSKYGIPSTTPPTEPGWYWAMFLGEGGWIGPVAWQVKEYEGGLAVDSYPISESHGIQWWPIPIEVPEVPK